MITNLVRPAPVSRLLPVVLTTLIGYPVLAQCPEEPQLQNYTTGGPAFVCPCFEIGEQAGAILNAPAAHYPIEILRVGIAWISQPGGAPPSLEEAVHIYPAGLPNPGTPLFSLAGPLLTEGGFNEFNLEPQPGSIVVNGGPFSTTLEFANANAGQTSAPSVVSDGNGCQAGKNLVFVIGLGWRDACQLGVSGDWLFYVVYRRVSCPTDVDEHLLTSGPILLAPRPNPAAGGAELVFGLAREEHVTLSVFDVRGRRVTTVADRAFPSGQHRLGWNAVDGFGNRLPAGIYMVEMRTPSFRSTRKLSLMESR